MVNWRHLVRVGARALCQILEGVPAALAAAWQLQLRPVSCVCQILIAAARAANSESCQILKGAAAAANFRPCQISMAAAIWPAPKFYHA